MSIGLIVIASLAAMAITAICFAWYTEQAQTGSTDGVIITYIVFMIVLLLLVITLAAKAPVT